MWNPHNSINFMHKIYSPRRYLCASNFLSYRSYLPLYLFLGCFFFLILNWWLFFFFGDSAIRWSLTVLFNYSIWQKSNDCSVEKKNNKLKKTVPSNVWCTVQDSMMSWYQTQIGCNGNKSNPIWNVCRATKSLSFPTYSIFITKSFVTCRLTPCFKIPE